ncbi:MAG TPA: MFS transporter [Armatimonadota bacterium]|nr:MFS transporter [Armatimonadota bacterium]
MRKGDTDIATTNAEPTPDSGRYKWWRIRIFIITWVAYASFYLTRKAFSVAKVGILADSNMNMSEESMGLFDGGYSIAYAMGQFFWGMMADKLGTRRVVVIGMIGSILVTTIMGFSTVTVLFGVLLFIQGLCQSTGWAPLNKTMANWFSHKERGRVLGFWCTNYAFGGLVASPFAGIMAGRVFNDWRYAFFAPAVLLGIIWVLFIILQRNRPEDVGLLPIEEHKGEEEAVLDSHEAPDEEPEGSWKVIGEVVRNRTVMTLGLAYFLQKPTRYAILFWGPVFVARRLHTDDMALAGIIASAFELAGVAGPIAAGFISDKCFGARRMPTAVIGLVLLSGVLCLFGPLTAGGNAWAMAGALSMIGFLLFGPDSLVSSTAAVDFGTRKGAGTAVGVVNGCGSAGQILGATLPGYIHNEAILFYIFAGATLLSACILAPMWNRRPPTHHEEDDDEE